jgi:hypothetical protein
MKWFKHPKEGSMTYSRILRHSMSAALLIAMFMWLGTLQAGDLNPAAIAFKMPDQIKWTTSPSGSSQAILTGDPSKPGLYIVLTKWSPNHMSRPHFHPNDRFITVISGTWWVGTGTKYDPASTVPLPPGSFVTHFGKQIHYDGAKDVECLLQIVGMGPAESKPAEVK